MKTKNILILAIAALIATILFYSFNGGSSDVDYIESLSKERQAKDEFMKSNEDSPFGDEKKNFKGLNYFPPDLSYRISAKLVPVENRKMVVLPTSDGVEKKYLEYAYAEFELNNTPCRLLILELVDNNKYKGTLFLAFLLITIFNGCHYDAVQPLKESTWEVVPLAQPLDQLLLGNIYFSTEQTGYIVAQTPGFDHSVLLTTEDGGDTWLMDTIRIK